MWTPEQFVTVIAALTTLLGAVTGLIIFVVRSLHDIGREMRTIKHQTNDQLDRLDQRAVEASIALARALREVASLRIRAAEEGHTPEPPGPDRPPG